MKKAMSLILALVMCLSLCACGGGSGGKSNQISMGTWNSWKDGKKELRFSISDIQLSDRIIVGTESPYFMKPISENEIVINASYRRLTKIDPNAGGVVIITMQLENTGKEDLDVYAKAFEVNYDDGNVYNAGDSGFGYYASSNGGWSQMKNIFATDKGIQLEKLTSGLVQVKVAIAVPAVVVKGSESLTFEFKGYSCKIR